MVSCVEGIKGLGPDFACGRHWKDWREQELQFLLGSRFNDSVWCCLAFVNLAWLCFLEIDHAAAEKSDLSGNYE